MAKKSMTIRLDPDQESRVSEWARENGASKSEAVAHFVSLGLDAADHGRPATVADLRDALAPVAGALSDLRGALPEAAEPADPEPPEVVADEATGDQTGGLGPSYWVGVGRAQVRRELAGDGSARLSAALAVACAALAVLLALALAGVIG